MLGGHDGIQWKAVRILDDIENRNTVTFIPEIIGSHDTFPMIGHNVEAKLVRLLLVIYLNN